MLPECNQMIRRPKTDYPLLEGFRTIRIKFCKTGSMQYISHLDMQRNIGRVLTRAGIPMWYTKGFNPHAKVIFALPLSIGAQSECEFIDLRIERDMSCEEIRDRLNAEMTQEMQISRAYIPAEKADFSTIAWADYDITIRCAGMDDMLPAQVQQYLTTSPVTVEKKSKSGLREIDIVPLIRSLNVTLDGEDGDALRTLSIRATLSASGADYLNPEYIIRVLKERFSLLVGDVKTEEYSIFRRRVLLQDGVTEFE
jgi:radical SAM-linked protein